MQLCSCLHGPDVDQILASEDVTSPSVAGDILWALTDHLGSVRDLAEYDSRTDTTRAVQKCRHTETAGNLGSVAAGGSLAVATLKAVDDAQGEGMALN